MVRLNLIKLCVGCDSPADLADWQAQRRAETGLDTAVHVTRMWPKRGAELLDGGSLYWVMRGVLRARQKIVGLEARTGGDGIQRCAIHLEKTVVLTEPVPRRAFQGWRYLESSQAPRDMADSLVGESALPEDVVMALNEFGVR